MIYEICAIVATIAFAVLVAFLAWTLRDLGKTLNQTHESLRDLNAEKLSADTSMLMQNLNRLTDQVQGQIETITPLVKSAGNVGDALQDLSSSLEKKTSQFKEEYTRKETQWQDGIIKVLAVSLIAAKAWNQLKNRR